MSPVIPEDEFVHPGFLDVGRFKSQYSFDRCAWWHIFLGKCRTPDCNLSGLPKLNFQVMRRTMATQAQSMGSVKDIQAHLRHAKADTTANEYMQELPESVKKMVGSVYTMLMKGGESQGSLKRLPQNATNSGEEATVSI